MKTPLTAFEGVPGAGKTTAIQTVVRMLRERGLKVGVVDIEDTAHARQLRAIARKYPLGSIIRILLFWVMRLEQSEAAKAMSGKYDIIIADRYIYSTVAFDGYGNKVQRSVVSWLVDSIANKPDLTLFLDVPFQVGRDRKQGGAKTMAVDSFAASVQSAYRRLARRHSWVRIDATKSKRIVAEECLAHILFHYTS